MPRPRKCRKVCHYPETPAFIPVDNSEGKAAVILTVDEYETIRLIDKEELSQEQCSECMKIARTTVQQIYTTARRKLAEALVAGVAVTYENGQIFQHFGHTEQFKIYDVEDEKILTSEVVDTNGSGHGALAGVLQALKVDALICGGIGGGARNALDAAGIKLYGGAAGDADRAVEALIAGNLEYNPDVQCSHHGDHHAHGGNCGEHGCGRKDVVGSIQKF